MAILAQQLKGEIYFYFPLRVARLYVLVIACTVRNQQKNNLTVVMNTIIFNTSLFCTPCEPGSNTF